MKKVVKVMEEGKNSRRMKKKRGKQNGKRRRDGQEALWSRSTKNTD